MIDLQTFNLYKMENSYTINTPHEVIVSNRIYQLKEYYNDPYFISLFRKFFLGDYQNDMNVYLIIHLENLKNTYPEVDHNFFINLIVFNEPVNNKLYSVSGQE